MIPSPIVGYSAELTEIIDGLLQRNREQRLTSHQLLSRPYLNMRISQILTGSFIMSSSSNPEPKPLDPERLAQQIQEGDQAFFAMNWKTALSAYETAYNMCASDPSMRVQQIMVKSKMSVCYTSLQDLGKAEECLLQLETLVQNDPMDAAAGVFNYANAVLRAKRGEIDRAIEHYGTAIDIYSENNIQDQFSALLHNNLGGCYFEQGNIENAIASTFQAISIYGQLNVVGLLAINAYNNLGTYLYKNGDADQALDSFSKAATMYQDLKHEHVLGAAVYKNLAVYWKQKSNPDKAHDNYSKAIEIYQKQNHEELATAQAYADIGFQWYIKGNMTKVIEHLTKATGIFDKLKAEDAYVAYANHNLGVCWLKKNNLEKALPHALAAAKICDKEGIANLNVANVYTGAALCLEQNGSIADAAVYADKALKVTSQVKGKSSPEAKAATILFQRLQTASA